MLGLNSCGVEMKLKGLNITLGQPTSIPAVIEDVSDDFIRIDAIPPQNFDRQTIVPLEMSCLNRRRVRRRLTAPDGVSFGLAFPTGTILEPEMLIFKTDSRAYVVKAALEAVLVIQTKDWIEAARVAHQIGNLHRDVQFSNISELELFVLWDGALELLLLRLNVTFSRESRPFLGRPSWEH
jgi:urease accessory protein